MRGGQALSRRLKRSAAAPVPSAPPAAPAPSRLGFAWALGLALLGLAIAAYLTWVHRAAYAGVPSICDINATLSCEKVATSPYSVVLGLPVAVWGGFAYLTMAALAASGLWGPRPHARWPAGLLVALSAVAVAVDVALALVSEVLIGAWCPACMVSWATSAALLGVSWWLARPVGRTLAADLAAVRARPGRALAALVAAALAVAGAEAAYASARYWNKARAEAPVARQGAPVKPPAREVFGPVRPARPADPSALVVVEFSDYECPFCARAHQQNKALFGGRTDVRLVRKQYPLDPTCNPAVRRPVHLTSCELARAALCADEQGLFEPMDDALFRNQVEHLPLEEVARGVGLDLIRFRACLGSAEVERRLRAEIDDGIAAGVHATPTYVVAGQNFSGELPPGALPPRP